MAVGLSIIVDNTNYPLFNFADVVREGFRICVGEVRKILIIYGFYRICRHDSRQIPLHTLDDTCQGTKSI